MDWDAHIVPRFARVWSVENQMITPVSKVTIALMAIIPPVILSQMRLVARAAPGRETRNVKKIRAALTMTTGAL